MSKREGVKYLVVQLAFLLRRNGFFIWLSAWTGYLTAQEVSIYKNTFCLFRRAARELFGFREDPSYMAELLESIMV